MSEEGELLLSAVVVDLLSRKMEEHNLALRFEGEEEVQKMEQSQREAVEVALVFLLEEVEEKVLVLEIQYFFLEIQYFFLEIQYFFLEIQYSGGEEVVCWVAVHFDFVVEVK